MVGVSTSCWEDFIVSAVGIMPGIDAAFPFVTILLWGPRIFIWGLDPSNPGIDTRIENREFGEYTVEGRNFILPVF